MKGSIAILLLSALITLLAFQTPKGRDGKKLYETHCQHCHGANGNKGFLGAGKLMQSKLDDTTAISIIQNVKRIMPSFRDKLTDAEVESSLIYIKSLRKIQT